MYVIEKRYAFETDEGICVKAFIREFFTAESLSVFTWPSALLLASFVTTNKLLFVGKTCIEIGAGNGLPSVIAGLLGAKLCILTERKDQLNTIENLKSICRLNGIESRSVVYSLDWSLECKEELASLPSIDNILGSDVFYSSEDFEPVISMIACILEANPGAVFYTSYQERSSNRSLCPYLQRYGLSAEVIPNSSFMHSAHKIGVCRRVKRKVPVAESVLESAATESAQGRSPSQGKISKSAAASSRNDSSRTLQQPDCNNVSISDGLLQQQQQQQQFDALSSLAYYASSDDNDDEVDCNDAGCCPRNPVPVPISKVDSIHTHNGMSDKSDEEDDDGDEADDDDDNEMVEEDGDDDDDYETVQHSIPTFESIFLIKIFRNHR